MEGFYYGPHRSPDIESMSFGLARHISSSSFGHCLQSGQNSLKMSPFVHSSSLPVSDVLRRL